VALYRDWRQRGNVGRERLRRSERVICTPLYKSRRVSLIDIEHPSGQQDVAGNRLSNRSDEALDIYRAQQHSETASGDSKRGIGRNDSQVARDDELQTRAQCCAVDRGDNRGRKINDLTE